MDNTRLGLTRPEAAKYPYIASMGVYVFKTDTLLNMLKWRYPTANDFGSEIIPAAVSEHDVQVIKITSGSPPSRVYVLNIVVLIALHVFLFSR